MKKIISLLLVLAVVFSFQISVFADMEKGEVIIEKEISYDEYIQSLAKKMNISIEEAKIYDEKQNEKYEAQLKLRFPKMLEESNDDILLARNLSSRAPYAGTYSYVTVSKSQTYPKNRNFSASVAAEFKIYSYNSFREIVSLQGNVYSYRGNGMYSHTWEQVNSWEEAAGGTYPTTSVTISATGLFNVVIDTSVGVNFDLPGFVDVSVGGGGSNTYVSDPMSIRYTYRLY